MSVGWPFSAGETVLIITTIGGVAVSIVTAFQTIRVNEKQNSMSTTQTNIGNKLEQVHSDTNGRMGKIDQELAETKSQLQLALTALRQQERVRVDLAHETARGQAPPMGLAVAGDAIVPIPVTAPEPLDVRVVQRPK